MSPRVLILLLLLSPFSRGADFIESQSRQFIIHFTAKHMATEAVPTGSMLVEPELLAISAERVRLALVKEIPALNWTRDKIHLSILDRPTPGSSVGIVSTFYTDGWDYRVLIPPVVDQERLVKAMIQVILVEYSNRRGSRGAEIPPWLIEGLAQELFYSVGPKLMVDQNSNGWEGFLRDMQGRTRETLRTNSAPSFNDLTTLMPPPANAPAEPLYQSSAHLLVRSLMQLPNGRQKLSAFLQMLPLAWNWQTSFRQAFGFERMLEVEKWWALVTVEFTSRDLRQAWSPAASLQKLDDLLGTRVEFHSSTNALPQTRVIDLRTLLRDDNWSLQRAALSEKINQLEYTAPHLAPQIGALAVEYKEALKNYVNNRQRSARSGLKMTPEAREQTIIDDALRNISSLDNKRRALAEPTVSAR